VVCSPPAGARAGPGPRWVFSGQRDRLAPPQHGSARNRFGHSGRRHTV